MGNFVFNAMSVIQSYIYENDTVNSSKFLVNFSRLMRLILENSPKEFIPLQTEIEILKKIQVSIYELPNATMQLIENPVTNVVNKLESKIPNSLRLDLYSLFCERYLNCLAKHLINT